MKSRKTATREITLVPTEGGMRIKLTLAATEQPGPPARPHFTVCFEAATGEFEAEVAGEALKFRQAKLSFDGAVAMGTCEAVASGIIFGLAGLFAELEEEPR
ncbi:MAG TPA: hypothetical protein VG796_01235 [Verrucomicrobiales bacterium]|nr:hypothetical protein [Verrucomicrobiales bacterium]